MPNKSLPLVSIVITSYNRAEFIGRAIESALKQDYPFLEVIIVDNCSTDNSDSIIRKYVKDPRVNYMRNDSNIGMIRNFQKGISVAKGDYITFISSDDYLIDSQFIAETVRLFQKHSNVVFVKGIGVRFFTGNEQFETYSNEKFQKEVRSGKEVFLEFQSRSSPMGFDGCVIDNKKLKAIDICYDPAMILLDNEINLKLCLVGDVAFIDKPCYAFRVHSNQSSKTYGNEILLGNLGIIDRAKATAISQNVFSANQLNDWYDTVVKSMIRYNYLKRYIQDFSAHAELEKIFLTKYPLIYKKVKKEPKILLLRMLYNHHYNLLRLLKIFFAAYHKKIIALKDNLE